jgi:hypothetical protein
MFDKDKFMRALEIKLPKANVKIGCNYGFMPVRQYREIPIQLGHYGALFRQGAFHANKFIDEKINDEPYLIGYRSGEHPICTMRVTGEAPKFSYCDAPNDWHESKEAALIEARISRIPIIAFLNKKQSFDGFVEDDSLIKTDVNRFYRNESGKNQCSLDRDVWWDGGIMNYPLIPLVRIFSEYARVKNYQWQCGYLTITATEELLKKGSLTELKPDKPKEPKLFYGDEWWDAHMVNNPECYWDEKCKHYYAAEEKYNLDFKQYQADLLVWNKL